MISKDEIIFGISKRFHVESITGTQPPSSGDWVIDDITIIKNDDIIVNGSIIINNGGALILENSTIRMNLNYPGQYKITVNSGGNLTIDNSKITAFNTTNYYTIEVLSGAVFSTNSSTIEYAGYFDYNTYTDYLGVKIETSNIVINKTIFRKFGSMMVYLQNCENVTIKNSKFEGVFNNHVGLYIENSINIKVINSTFIDAYEVILDSKNILFLSNKISQMNVAVSLGVLVRNSLSITFNNNSLIKNNIRVYGNRTVFETLNIYKNNTVNGLPIRFYYNVSSMNFINSTYGELIIAYSQDIVLSNIIVHGVEICYSENVNISEIQSTLADFGILVANSTKVKITNNVINEADNWGINIVLNSDDIIVKDNMLMKSYRSV